MARRDGIRWKVGEKEELAREIRNFNQRRRRAIRKNPELAGIIPTIPEVSTIKAITTRKDLQRLLKDINLSRKPDAFKITKVGAVNVTKWELSKAKSRLRTVNSRRAAERRKANVSTYTGTMGTIAQNALNPKKIPEARSREEWRRFVTSVEKQARDGYDREKDQLYQLNYFDAFTNTYGLNESLDLWQLLKKLTAQEIVDAMYKYPILNIEFLYDDRIEHRSEHMDDVIETWKRYIKEIGK